MSSEQSNQSVLQNAGLYRFLLYEYPSHLGKKKREEIKKLEKTNEYCQTAPFLIRINSITWSTILYRLILILYGVELVVYLLPLIPQTIMKHYFPLASVLDDCSIHWPAVIIKIIGISLCFSSFLAWKKQLWREEEYYGWALGDYSKDEPVYRMLANLVGKKQDNNSQMEYYYIVGDWLKNRPSVPLLLSASILCLHLHQFPIWEEYSNAWILQAIISIVFVALCFTKTSAGRLLRAICQEENSHGWYQCRLIGKILIPFILLVLFLFALAFLIDCFSSNIFMEFLPFGEWRPFALLCLSALVVYLILVCISIYGKGKRERKSEDNREKISMYLSGAKGEASEITDAFGELSCKGQMKVLNDPKFRRWVKENRDQLINLEEKAYNVQVLDMILSLYYQI